MNLKPFEGPGATPTRRKFWNEAFEAVMGARKVAGRHVMVDEHPGKGSVINVADSSARRGGGPTTGACCIDGACSILTEADCTTAGGTFQGIGTDCDPNPCLDCVVTSEFVTPGCRGTGGGATQHEAWLAALSDWTDCTDSPFSCVFALGFKAIGPQAEADSCPLRFTLVSSTTGHCNVSGVIRTRDDIAGLVDETPFSFTLASIGATHDLTFDPYEPENQVGSAPNSTHSQPEDIIYDCS